VVAPVEERVVKAAVDGVEAPIAVVLIPVLSMLKFPEEIVRVFPPREREEALNPERLRVPLVAVRLSAPDERVKPLDAVSSCATVNAPLLVVVTPVAPRVIAEVFVVPMLIAPLVVPAPALIMTFPPVPPVPDSNPPVRFNAPPFPAAALFDAGWRERELPPVKVVISEERPPARAS